MAFAERHDFIGLADLAGATTLLFIFITLVKPLIIKY